jgi:hypothetical protein
VLFLKVLHHIIYCIVHPRPFFGVREQIQDYTCYRYGNSIFGQKDNRIFRKTRIELVAN